MKLFLSKRYIIFIMNIWTSFTTDYLRRSDYIIMSISIALSLMFLHLLRQPVDASFKRDLRAIAQTSKGSYQVKRKLAGSLSWSEIEGGSKLFQKDEVFSGKDYSAEISFLKSKTIIILPPISLIRIEENNGLMSIEIKEGKAKINLKANTKINIISEGKIYTLSSDRDSQISIFLHKSGVMVSALSGNVTVSQGNQQKTAKENETIKMNDNLQINKIKDKKIEAKNKTDTWTDELMLKLDKKNWEVRKGKISQ